MKAFKTLIIAAVFAVTAAIPAFAAQKDIKVIVSGTEVVFADQQPVIQDGRILVPIRGVFEPLVPKSADEAEIFTVTWDDKTSTATIKNEWYTVTIKAGENTFTSNGKTITPDVPPQIINGRLMLPLRAISEAVDAKVDWDGENNTVKIYYEPAEIPIKKSN